MTSKPEVSEVSMNRTSFLARLALLAPLLLVAALLHPGTSGAQYVFLDANDDGVHTDADVLNPSGATHVAIWLDTSHDRDGTLRSCNSHTGAPVGAVTDTDVFSYDIYLVADH